MTLTFSLEELATMLAALAVCKSDDESDQFNVLLRRILDEMVKAKEAGTLKP